MLPRTLIGAMSPQMSVLQRFGTPALDLNLAGDSTLDTRITATRASTKTYFDSTGTMQTTAFNLLTYSEQFDNAAWTKSNVTVSANAVTAPDGTTTADKLMEAATNSTHLAVGAATTVAGVMTASVYAKAGERTFIRLILFDGATSFAAYFNASTGAVGTTTGAVTTTVSNVGGGWYRVVITATTASGVGNMAIRVASADNVDSYLGDGTSGLYIWGAQLETGTTATDYIRTEAAASGAFPLEYDPSTLKCLGRSFWEARTNSIRNNTMQGASAGTPGTMPTNWWTYSVLTGLTREIVGTGTESGINYIDIRVYGTPSGTGQYLIAAEVNTAAPAVSGQTWTMSEFCKLAAGSLSGVSFLYNTIAEYNSGSVFLTSTSTAFTLTSAALATQRYTATRTLTQATCASTGGYLTLVLSGAAVDFTLRIGMPQFEQGATATPVISTSTVAVTRAADVVSMTGTNFSSWYNQTEGTFLVSAMVPYVTAASQFRRVLEANDGTANKEILITYYQAAGVNRSYGYIKDTTEQADLNTSSANGNTSAGTAYTSVVAYKANDFAASHLGTSVLTDTSGTVPTNNQLLIGGTPVANQHINGYISRITYWNRRLANADLQILSRST